MAKIAGENQYATACRNTVMLVLCQPLYTTRTSVPPKFHMVNLNAALSEPPLPIGYKTALGIAYISKIEDALESKCLKDVRGKINLIFTSPPFPLAHKKEYGNKTGDDYLHWLSDLAPRLSDLLATDGSLVIEMGNAWESGKPVMSTLPMEVLLAFRRSGGLNLCQQFICHNPTRLPGP